MDIRKIKKLIEIIEESDIAEIEIIEGEESVRINRYSSHATPVAYAAAHPPLAVAAAPTIAEPVAIEQPSGHVVKSPMVGTFYRAVSPEDSPYVQVGDVIHKGDVLCIIEAMKLFNEIESEVSGKIVKVLIDDQSPVEYDQPLFVVDPA